MKITNFSFTLRQAATTDGYGDNYYVNIDENGNANISHPYKTMPYKEQAAILSVIQSAIINYGMLINECDRANQKLKLEEYAESSEPTSEEEKGIAAAKLSAAQELELALKSASPQTCALGGGEVATGIQDAPFEEVSRGADGDIDKPKHIVVTDEDIFGE